MASMPMAGRSPRDPDRRMDRRPHDLAAGSGHRCSLLIGAAGFRAPVFFERVPLRL
jgi:hypothetical protein